MACKCFIVPQDVLQRLSADSRLSEEQRRNFAFTAAVSQQVRDVRQQAAALTATVMSLTATTPLPSLRTVATLAGAAPDCNVLPACQIYDCRHGTTLPGAQIANPSASTDASSKRAFTQTQAVAKFYCMVFHRDSLDNQHMTMLSTVHYFKNFTNAFWNGSQMVYGDGDGQNFIDFTLGNDVIGHELTHGVTQHSAGLSYVNQPGGLNESISDVFGSMFRQWQATQDVNAADWLIGADIIGPQAKALGYTCLRNMANPADTHALGPQPTNFSQYHDGMDPHSSSGIPNLAFYKAAKAVGGNSWDKVGQIWYQALTNFPPDTNLSMLDFANRTRNLSTGDATVHSAIDTAWTAVGL